jgi:UDP-N-acetylmuramoyl-tripeptide--D-alanyl-D-alanine ligase
MATVEAVARENGSVFASLDADGTAVFPADDDYTPLWRELADGAQGADLRALGRRRPHRHGAMGGGMLEGGRCDARPATPISAAYRRPAQRQERAGRRGLRAGGGRAAGRDLRGPLRFEPVKGRSRAIAVARRAGC